jgi:transposase InsO family protein
MAYHAVIDFGRQTMTIKGRDVPVLVEYNDGIRTLSSSECSVPSNLESSKDDTPVPPFLMDLFLRSTVHLDAEQSERVANLLSEFHDVFSRDDDDIGNFSGVQHHIDTGDAAPIKIPMRRTPVCFEKDEAAHLKSMLDKGIIEPSQSPWAAAPVLIRKKDGRLRWCIDWRLLNSVTKKDSYPLPNITQCYEALKGCKYFSSLDATSGYWQIELAPEDREKTAFSCKFGLHHFCKMGFGLCNAPATYQRAMEHILKDLLWQKVICYIDDVILGEMTFEEHLELSRQCFLRFRQHKLKLRPKKCNLFQLEAKVLGHILNEHGIALNPENVEHVRTWLTPTNIKELQSFLGFANYHRMHIKGFSNIVVPLNHLLNKDISFHWEDEQVEAFGKIKDALCSAPVLSYPNSDDPFILDCDASCYAIGGELIQVQNQGEKVIAYGSYTLTPEQRRYCTTRKELLALVRFTRKYRHYLLGRKVTVRTDHSSLAWLMKFKHIEGQLARWLEELSCYDLQVLHRPGKLHTTADPLSRLPDDLDSCDCYRAGCSLESLPCGGCPYCTRAHMQWARFEEECDDVLPLGIRTLSLTLDDPAHPDPVLTGSDDPLFSVFQDENLDSELGLDDGDFDPNYSLSAFAELNDVGRFELGLLPLFDTGIEGPNSSLLPDSGNLNTDFGSSDLDLQQTDPPNNSDLLPPNSPDPDSDPDPDPDSVPPEPDSVSCDANIINVDTPAKNVMKSQLDVPVNWMGVFTSKQLTEAQNQDCDLIVLITWLKEGITPSVSELKSHSAAIKHLWLCRSQLELEDGRLRYIWDDVINSRRLMVIPKSLREKVLFLCHDLPTAGHLGRDYTLSRLRRSFFWYGMYQDCVAYVASCANCNKNKKAARKMKAALQTFSASVPMERVHLDILGPFIPSAKGNLYILMIIDQFTRWIECFPLPHQSAEDVAQAFVFDFISHLGCPISIHTDQGRNFVSKLFSAVCELLQIAKTRTTPYHPSSNGQVERYNRTVLQLIRAFLKENQRDWDHYLPLLAGVIRAMPNRSTGFSPNMMMLGREVHHPPDLIFGFPGSPTPVVSEGDYVKLLREKLEYIHQVARKHLGVSMLRRKKDYDIHLRINMNTTRVMSYTS